MATHPTHEPPKGPHMAAPQTGATAPKAAPAPTDAPPRQQMEMGGSGTAKASFQDASGATCDITSSEWLVTGPVTVKPDDKDPSSATLTPTGVGPVTVTVNAITEDGPAQASTDLMVIESASAPVAGTIAITVQAPAAAKKAA